MAELSFFERRLKELGVKPKHNQVMRPDGDKEKAYPVFEETEKGDIRINYFDLRGMPYHYRKSGAKWPQSYSRVRLQHPKEGMKYYQPKGSGSFPFFTPGIIAKYKAKERIETLIFTEGEFKAFKGNMDGLDIIGFPSIHGPYTNSVHRELHPDIIEIIRKCQVERVIFLTDADTLTVNLDAEDPNKDLYKRPNSFYTAVRNFRESRDLLIDDKLISLKYAYYCYIRPEFRHDGKGLDDLLVNYRGVQSRKQIIDELQTAFFSKYFKGWNLTEGKLQNLRREFGLTNVEDFYSLYREFLGNKEFRWKNSRYQFDGNKVVYLRHEEVDHYMRVGPDYMKIIRVPNRDGDLEEEIVPWKKTEIKEDYKRFPDFMDQIQRYDAFCNEPAWNGSYKRKHGNCYNICNPINFDPKEGSIENTLKFLKHLFGGQGEVRQLHGAYMECGDIGDQFTIALDYLSIQYRKPKQKLPVPCLVSPEERTGKTTFLNWLRSIYGSNATILDNERFKMNFNAHYITKFIIGLDEGFLDVEKKAEKERLKQMATADEAFMENKGMNVKKFPYYGNLIICSNDADRLMKMEDADSRWFVVRVPQLTEPDPDLENKLKAEIPAWLHFIKHRQIIHPRKDRLWFKKDWIITEQFKLVVQATKNRLDRVIETFIKEQFLLYRSDKLRYPLKYLAERINETAKYRIDESDLRDFLSKRGMDSEKVQRIKIPYGIDLDAPDMFGKGKIKYNETVARPYIFYHDEWLNPSELEEFYSSWEPYKYEEEEASVPVAPGEEKGLPF